MEKKVYETNPFTPNLTITKSNKLVSIGKPKDLSILDVGTGELSEISDMFMGAYKQVDNAQFVKLYANSVGMFLDLSSAGVKVFAFLCWAVQKRGIGTDKVRLGRFALTDFTKEVTANGKKSFSYQTLMRGIQSLEEKKVIARTTETGTYFINPSFIFNGNRLVLYDVIEKTSSPEQ